MRGTTAARLGLRRGLVLRGLGAQAHRQHSDDTPLQPGGASMTDSNRVNTETKRWRPPPSRPVNRRLHALSTTQARVC